MQQAAPADSSEPLVNQGGLAASATCLHNVNSLSNPSITIYLCVSWQSPEQACRRGWSGGGSGQNVLQMASSSTHPENEPIRELQDTLPDAISIDLSNRITLS
jgi:hypothetical protein